MLTDADTFPTARAWLRLLARGVACLPDLYASRDASTGAALAAYLLDRSAGDVVHAQAMLDEIQARSVAAGDDETPGVWS